MHSLLNAYAFVEFLPTSGSFLSWDLYKVLGIDKVTGFIHIAPVLINGENKHILGDPFWTQLRLIGKITPRGANVENATKQGNRAEHGMEILKWE